MATSVACGTPLWVDGPGVDAENPLRQFDIGTRVFNAGTTAANQVPGGVFPGGGAMAVNAGSGMNVVVSAGYCCVPAVASIQGGYIFGLMNSGTLTVAAADPSSPRIDLVVARVFDLGTSSSTCDVELVTGVPAGSPSAPAAPAASIVLAQILVPAAAASITSANITDERDYVVAPGGVLPIANAASAPAVPATQAMIQLDTGAIVTGSGTAGQVNPIPILPWSPVQTLVTAPVSDTAAKGALTTIATASISVDGSTDIEIYYKWAGFKCSTAGTLVTVQVSIGGTVLDQTVILPQSTSVYSCGGSARAWTSAGQGNTPAAGTHTITFAFQSASSTPTTTMDATATALGILRITPVTG